VDELSGWAASSLVAHYRPRGAKELVVGGADGLTVLFGRSGFTIWRPEGPLPLDHTGETFGGAVVLGQGHI
jgi:hypothetical protein